MKKLFGILVCLLAVFLFAFAAADVAIDETHFPDEIFREYVKRFDKDGSGMLTEAELNAVDSIDLGQASDYVHSIQGIEFFPVLHSLNCGGHPLSSLDLKQNKQLKELDCHYCYYITSLDLSQNWALTSLNCDQCQISSLDLSANPALETLSCNENSMASLNLKDHASLKSLNCDACDLQELNLEGCDALTDVVCSRNNLSNLDLSTNKALTSLDCDANQLKILKLPESIQKLVCSRNSFGSLNLSGLYNLTDLDCFNCSLTGINLSGCSSLKNLSLCENQLTSVDVSDCSFLSVLDVSENKLTDIDLSSCFVLSGLICWDNTIDMLDITWCLNLSEAYQKGTQDQPLRFVTRYSYQGSWLTVDEGQKIKAANNSVTPTPVSIAKAKITVSDQVYTGAAIEPKLTVTLKGKKLKAGTDYTASFKKNRKIGTATVTVTGKGNYNGKATASFRINPRRVALSRLVAGKESLTVNWKKESGIDGYEIEYSLKESFKDAEKKIVRDPKTTEYEIRNLNGNRTYYVRIRAYRKVDGKKYVSAWSKARSAKTEK